MFDVILLDLFFTLISTYDNEEDKVHECHVAGIDKADWTKVAVAQMYNRSIGVVNTPVEIVRDIMNVFQPGASEETIEAVTRLRIERYRHTLFNVNKDNLLAIRRIRALGKKVCLVSNADVIDVIGWQGSPLRALFDEVVFSCEVGVAKPDHRIYEIAMNKFGVEAERCLFVGDGGNDELRGAKGLGIATVLTTQFRGKLWPDTVKLIEKDADYKIGHLSELLTIID